MGDSLLPLTDFFAAVVDQVAPSRLGVSRPAAAGRLAARLEEVGYSVHPKTVRAWRNGGQIPEDALAAAHALAVVLSNGSIDALIAEVQGIPRGLLVQLDELRRSQQENTADIVKLSEAVGKLTERLDGLAPAAQAQGS